MENLNKLTPAIVQDADTRMVLMLGYMNEESLRLTRESGKVCFFSRSRRQLWTKGEKSGNFLRVVEILSDCDNDTWLIKARPAGPVCHTGADTCWGEQNIATNNDFGDFLFYLESFLRERSRESPDNSYTARLFSRGINRIAQKVGEEAVELLIEAKDNNKTLFLGEAADLMYHYIVLLLAKGFSMSDVVEVLKGRHMPEKN